MVKKVELHKNKLFVLGIYYLKKKLFSGNVCFFHCLKQQVSLENFMKEVCL